MKTAKARFHLTQQERYAIHSAIRLRLEYLVYLPEHKKFASDALEITALQSLTNVFKYREKRDKDRP